jgi:hypothetical protein
LAIRTPSKKKEKMFVLLFVGTIKSMEWMCRLHVTIIPIQNMPPTTFGGMLNHS